MVKEFGYHINMRLIANSGQCFRMKQISDTEFSYGNKIIKQLDGKHLLIPEEVEFLFPENVNMAWLEYKMDSSGDYLKACSAYGTGLRILCQPVFEMIITAIITQRNNIPRIRHTIDSLCVDGEFPTRDYLLYKDLSYFTELGLGYRDIYVYDAVRICTDDFIETLCNLRTSRQKIELLKKLRGVGDKVANCIALFALGCCDAFPIDTWISKALARENPNLGNFSGYEGIVQQYMFEYERRAVSTFKN